jgi:ribosome-associated protein
MNCEELKKRIQSGEITFSTSRSSGPGGQNVNKVNTKVELRFNIYKSVSFSELEKEKIIIRLKNKITVKGDLLIFSQSARTQLLNKQKAEEKFYKLICKTLEDKPVRRATSPTLSSSRERLEKKKKKSILKKLRKESSLSNDD